MTTTPRPESTGPLVRLVVQEDGEIVGGAIIAVPLPWVYRQPYLVPEDVD